MKVRKPNPPDGGEKFGWFFGDVYAVQIYFQSTTISIRSHNSFAEGD